ncbi:MAG: hypothetical protein IJC88_06535 [Oscillospiraceae bacterium]|nr:hypothetical protein [Oscillospiraceae bacterium]
MKKSRILALLLALCLVTTAFAVLAGPTTEDGAQVRTEGAQGLRFISYLRNVELASCTEYGTILVPTAGVSSADEFVIGATLGGYDVAKVPALINYKKDADNTYFTAVITDIDPDNYTREYSARAYAVMGEDTLYSDVTTSRDVYTVAKAALADTSADLTADAQAVLQKVVDYVEGYTVAVNFTKPVEDAQVPLTIEVDGYDATISWTRTGGYAHTGKFASGTDYTCTVTLTSTEKISPKAKISINGKTYTTTRSADGKTISAKRTYEFKDSGYSGIY